MSGDGEGEEDTDEEPPSHAGKLAPEPADAQRTKVGVRPCTPHASS